MKAVREKLRDSEFATEVNERIEAITAVHVDHVAIEQGKLMPDPDRVAEYLDNVMKQNEVMEFELLCLDNEAWLAEVASCHNVLAEFLQAPISIAPVHQRQLQTQILSAIDDVARMKDERSRTSTTE